MLVVLGKVSANIYTVLQNLLLSQLFSLCSVSGKHGNERNPLGRTVTCGKFNLGKIVKEGSIKNMFQVRRHILVWFLS